VTSCVKNEKSGITVIAAPNSLFFLLALLLLLPSLVLADRITAQTSVAGFFDSNIEHLAVWDALTMGKRSGFFIRNEGAFDYVFGDNDAFSTAFSLSSDTGLNVPEKSRLNSFFEIGWHGEPRDDLSLDLALQAHHTAENYLHMRNMFLDLLVTGDLFWDFSDDDAFYSTVKASYFTGFDEDLRYMTGPTIGAEFGYFYYPTARTDYLKVGAGFDGAFFRPERWTSCSVTLSVKNASIKPYLLFEGKYDLKPVFLKGTLRYAYMEWLEEDRFIITDIKDWSKKRKEHTPSLSTQILWDINDYISLSLNYTYRYIFSNFSRNNGAYVDYTMDRHTVMLEFSAHYEGETK